MSNVFQFPAPVARRRIVTGMMRTARSRTFAVHSESPLVVWSGRHRIGKTTTAQWMEEEINAACAAQPKNRAAFRAVHYEVGAIADRPAAAKLAIRGLLNATVGAPDRGDYLQSTADELAELCVAGLRKLRLQMVMIDEAGLLPLRAIGGLVQVRDLAEKTRWSLTMVLIGMDDLPIKLRTRPQIRGRVHDWLCFEAYTVNETAELLAVLHPMFADLDPDVEEDLAILQWLHEKFEGVPGELVPFIRRLQPHLEKRGALSVDLLKAVNTIMTRDRERMTNAAKEWSRGTR